jgi:hypothetical protein
VETAFNANYNCASDEFIAFEKLKRKRFLPVLKKTDQNSLKGVYNNKQVEICVGPVVERGKDLPSGKNLADYIDSRGRIDLLKFFDHHKKSFPNLWILVQRKASCRVTEVGCERFFALSGYVSAPRRTRLGVRTYERLAMLSSIIDSIYIDPEFVAAEYLRQCKEKKWKTANDEDALKCWNLELAIEAELENKPVTKMLTMDDIIEE